MTISDEDFEFLKRTVAKRSANVLNKEHKFVVESRLEELASERGCIDVHAVVSELRSNASSPLHDAFADKMTINETSFFRDKQPFEALRTTIVPQLIEAGNIRRELKIWSAAASSGQEAYSIAMLLMTHFPVLKSWKTSILASDYSAKMLQRIQQGEYSQLEVGRGLPAPMLVKFFKRQGLKWVANPEMRRLIETRRMNLATPWNGTQDYDIVFLRNVLIYFDPNTRLEILQRICQSMKPTGYLFLGSSESLLSIPNAPFQRDSAGGVTCYRPKSSQPAVSSQNFQQRVTCR